MGRAERGLKTQLDVNMGLLLLAGVYRSCNDATASLWDGESGCSILHATMSLQTWFYEKESTFCLFPTINLYGSILTRKTPQMSL